MNKLRGELNTRIFNGEKDLIIKYVKGTPSIVSNDRRSSSQKNTFFNKCFLSKYKGFIN